MDLVNCVYSKSTRLSDPIEGRVFQDEWSKLFVNAGFTNYDRPLRYDNKVAGKLNMDLTSKDYINLKVLCSEEKLKCEGVDALVLNKKALRKTAIPNIEKELNDKEELATVSIQKKDVIKRNLDLAYRSYLLSQWRYVHHPEQSALLPVSKKSTSICQSLIQEIVFIVQVFRPVSFEVSLGPRKCQNFAKRLCHVIAVLGGQTLAALRDKIMCCSDHMVLGEFSENPTDCITGPKAKEVIQSAFFYIGDTFYNDLRHETCVDYSKDLINHAGTHSKMPVKLYSKSMTDVKIRNLKIQLGYPYLYLHQGNCEHIIVFSDIRLLNPEEIQDLASYPLVCRIAATRRIVCMICETFTASWITRGNKRLSMDPYFFCDLCFHSFNYSADGKKVGDFRAYCYVDRASIS